MHLFDLFDVILFPVLSDWLEIDGDLVMLDSACCNLSHRINLLRIFAANDFVHDNKKISCQQADYYRWLSSKQLKIKDFDFDTLYDKRRLDSEIIKILSYTTKIRRAELNNNLNCRRILDQYCSNIESLVFGFDTEFAMEEDDTLTDPPITEFNNFPDFINRISGLKHLDVSQCERMDFSQLSYESVEKSLSGLQSFVSHTFPTHLVTKCAHLNSLYIHGDLTADNLSVLTAHCPQLTQLICDNRYCDEIDDNTLIKFAEKCFKLRRFAMRNQVVTDVGLCRLVELCSQLQYLDVSRIMKITDVFLIAVAKHCAQSLTEFLCNRCTAVSDKGVVELVSKCMLLKRLSVSGCTLVSDVSVMAIANHCKHMESLQFGHTTVSDAFMPDLINRCPKLTSLGILKTNVTHTALVRFIHGCDKICLDILTAHQYASDWFVRYERGLRSARCALQNFQLPLYVYQTIAHLCPNLRSLHLCNHELTDAAMLGFVEHCPLLADVSIIKCAKVTTAALVVMLGRCEHLHSFSTDNRPDLTNDMLERWFTTAKSRVRKVSLSQCPNFSSPAIMALAKNCPELRDLCVDHNTQLDNGCLVYLVRHCTKLKSLSVKYCALSGYILGEIGQCGENLRVFDGTGNAWENEQIYHFLLSCPWLLQFINDP